MHCHSAEMIDLSQAALADSRQIASTLLSERLDLEKIFGRNAPLQVDLGCGDGSFLYALAQEMPAKNFLGVERLAGRVSSSTCKAAKIDNVRILRAELAYTIRFLLPPESVETFYLLFPDPWPKRRHRRRRVVSRDFLNAIRHALVPNGVLHVATDQRDYFEQIRERAMATRDFAVVDLTDSPTQTVDLPRTTFETRYRAEGAPIHRLELRKISPVT
ncbi:MAG: tRNA (guanosine(46)-N7)-methyltransferase TrmB [Spartobacteria bacterium]